ncbi:MAG: hypothetical protein QM733_07540 [Ilumatobacteraceae bacterium]
MLVDHGEAQQPDLDGHVLALAGDLGEPPLGDPRERAGRIDRLERQGYVTRRTADTDRRGRVVALTAAGRRLTDRLFPQHLANEAALLADLSANQREQLARLLKILTLRLEGADDT